MARESSRATQRAVPRACRASPACSNPAPSCCPGFEIRPVRTPRAFGVGNNLPLKFRRKREKTPFSGLMPMLHCERSEGKFHGGKRGVTKWHIIFCSPLQLGCRKHASQGACTFDFCQDLSIQAKQTKKIYKLIGFTYTLQQAGYE